MFGSPLIFETDPSRLHLSDGSPPDPGRGSAQAPGSGLAKPEAPDITTSPPLTKKKEQRGGGGSPQARTGIKNKRTLTICASSSAARGLDSALDSAAGGRSPPSRARLREALLWTLAPVPVSLSPRLRCSPVFNRTFLFSLRRELARYWLPVSSWCVQEPSDKPATEALQHKCCRTLGQRFLNFIYYRF